MAGQSLQSRGFPPGWLNFRVVIGAFAVGFSLFCGATGMLVMTRQGGGPPPATAILNVIQAPTTTHTPAVASTPLGNATSPVIPPSPPPGEIAVGVYVQVRGTGGDGLRLRIEPSLNGQILMLGSESEIFRVHDGPRQADGYTWWYLVGPFDETRYGWAVANFLVLTQGP